MSNYMADILAKLGWSDGYQIPIANEENKALERELAELYAQKVKTLTSLEVNTGRLDALQNHFKYLCQEKEHGQKLISTQNQQLDFVRNQYHISLGDKSKTDQSNKNLQKLIKEAEERLNTKKTTLQKGVEKADLLKAEVEWDVEALKAWEEALQKRADMMEFVEKFKKEDVMIYNTLEAKRQHLQMQLADMKEKAIKLASDAKNSELVIDRTGKVIKQLANERVSLTDRWKDAIKVMRQRDNESVRTQEDIVATLELIQKEEELLAEKDAFLENEKKTNKKIELELQSLNNSTSIMRRSYNEMAQYILQLNSELFTVKRHIAASAQHLENERTKSKNIIRTMEEQTHLCEKFEQEIIILKSKISAIMETQVNAGDRISNIEKMIDHNEKIKNIIVADTERVNSSLYRLERTLVDQQAIGKLMEIDIANDMNNCAQLVKMIQSEKKNLDKIKEVVYNMEYHIDEIEKKLKKIEDDSKLQGIHSDEREKQINELEQVLMEHKDVQNALQSHVDRLQDEMRRLTNTITLDTNVLNMLKNKCETYMLIYQSGLKQMAAAKKAMQEKQVEENVVKLHLQQIEKEKKKEEKDIFTLEKLRIKLDHAMKDRQMEIDTKFKIEQNKKRNLEEDKGRLKTDLNLRRLKIEQLQKKYHLTIMCLGKNEDGEPYTVSYFKIKDAQDKYFLQQKGDELDKKIKTAESEIVAMENTLKLLNVTNTAFKNSVTLIKENDKEFNEMKVLEEKLKEVQNHLKYHRNILEENEKELEEMKSEFEKVLDVTEKHQNEVNELESELEEVKKQEIEKDEKLARVEGNLKKTLAKLKGKNVTKYERDLEIRQIKEANEKFMSELKDTAILYEEVAPKIMQYSAEYKIQLPRERFSPSSGSFSIPSSSNSRRSDSSEQYVSTVCLTPEFG